MLVGGAIGIPLGAALPAAAQAALAIHPTRTDDPSSGGITCSFLPANNTDCSLRNALVLAGDGTIVSLAPPAPGGPYRVQSTPLTISHNITLAGVGARTTTIEQTGAGGVLEIGSGVTGATVEDLTVTGGHSQDGGGILNLGGLTLRDSAVAGNVAAAGASPSAGGGIDSEGTLTMIGSTVSRNEAAGNIITMQPGFGGGMFIGGTTTIVNSTISGNAAGPTPIAGTGDGGGIYMGAGSPTLSLSNVTLTSNSANGSAGNLYRLSGTASAKDTIIGLGTASDAGTENCNGAVVSSLGYNLEDRNQCGLAGTGDQTNTDPLLGAFQNNGGPTDTQGPSLDSPAVDHGNPAGCTDASNAPLTVDQRGLTRPQGLACDVGAYELQPVAPAASASPATGIGQRGATLNGSVNTHGFQTSWHFEYGPTTAYGSSTPTQTLAGGAQLVSAMITGLLPGTTNHFALVASTSGGTTETADQTFTTAPSPGGAPSASGGQPPVLGPIAIAPSAFRAAASGASIAATRRTGATVTYTDTQPSTTAFTVQRARPGVTLRGRCVPPPKHSLHKLGRACTRYVAVGGFTRTDASGRNRFRFTGRVGARKLPPGNYGLDATPRSNGKSGKTVHAHFRILR